MSKDRKQTRFGQVSRRGESAPAPVAPGAAAAQPGWPAEVPYPAQPADQSGAGAGVIGLGSGRAAVPLDRSAPAAPGADPTARSWFTRAVRSLSGMLTGVVWVLLGLVIVAEYFASQRHWAGPTSQAIALHVVGAVAATISLVLVDRARAAGALVGGALILAVTAFLLWTQWWN